MDFSGFAGKNHEFDFGLYSWEQICAEFMYSMFESNKNGIHMVVFVTLCPGRTCKAARCVEVTQNSGLKHNEMTTNRVSQEATFHLGLQPCGKP